MSISWLDFFCFFSFKGKIKWIIFWLVKNCILFVNKIRRVGIVFVSNDKLHQKKRRRKSDKPKKSVLDYGFFFVINKFVQSIVALIVIFQIFLLIRLDSAHFLWRFYFLLLMEWRIWIFRVYFFRSESSWK